jgi:hypothetical protein
MLSVIDAPLPLFVQVERAMLTRPSPDGRNGPGPKVCPITLDQLNSLVTNTKGDRVSPSATTVEAVRPIRGVAIAGDRRARQREGAGAPSNDPDRMDLRDVGPSGVEGDGVTVVGRGQGIETSRGNA